MTHQVDGEVDVLVEAFATFGTCKRLLARVSPFMYKKLRLVRETLAAVRTYMGLLPPVKRQMLLKVQLSHKTCLALKALKREVCGSSGLVEGRNRTVTILTIFHVIVS